MTLQWFGQSFFKINTKNSKGEDLVIVIDPFDKECGLPLPNKFGADIVLITHDHHDHNNTELIKGTALSPEPFIISGPGEYEIKGVMVYGISSFHDNEQGAKYGENTMYLLETENVWLAHLGDLGQKELTDEQLQQLKDMDLLLVPVGGTWTLNAKDANEIVSEIEPRIVIPMHYKLPGLKINNIEGVEKFIKELGVKPEEVDKFKIQKKDLPEEETKLILLKN